MNTSPAPSDQALTDALAKLLTVAASGPDAFEGGAQPGGVGRVFGGQVVGQALQAAQATAPEGMAAHSLHAYFLRGGTEGQPTRYTVHRDLDGRSFANRRVVASQEGKPILTLTASFQRAERGLEHTDAPMPDVPAPDTLPDDRTRRRAFLDAAGDAITEQQRAFALRPRPIELRACGDLHWTSTDPAPPRASTWLRVRGRLPDDAALHRAVLAYASDYTLLGTAALPHGLSWMRGELVGASLDHAVWFHAPALEAWRADEWLLYTTDSPWSGGGRGFNRGRLFTANGRLIASTAQEGMMRRKRAKPTD